MIKFSIAKNVRAKETYICKSRGMYEMKKETQARIKELAERIKASTDEKEQQTFKKELPIRIMNGWIAETADVNGKMVGKERKAENVTANGACVCDFDHLGCSAREVWPGIREKALALNPLLVEVSIREEGLHFIGMCPKGLTIQESVVWYGLKLGLVEYADKAVHDLARALYCVPRENILYIDEYALWGDKEPYVPVPTEEEIAAVREILGKKVVTENPCEIPTTAKPVTENSSKDFPTDYLGIPFADIRDELLRLSPDIELDENGLPKVGFRHNAEVMLAQNMKTITDSNVEWLKQIIPNYEEDETAWRQACESARSYEVKYQSSDLLKKAIKNLKEKQNAAKKSANKEGEKRPHLLIRTCMPTMTEAVVIRRTSEAEREGRKFLYCYYDELKDMMGLSSSKRAIKAISCHAFESKKYGKECDGKDYLSARAPMRFNHHFNAVPADAKAWFESGIHDGYFNRYSLAYIVKDRSLEFRYGDFDDDYAQRLEQYLQRIREFEGEIICPQAAEVARQLNNAVDEYVSQTYDEEFEELSRRALIIAHRKALIVFIASGCKWSKEIADFMRWSFKYDMWVKLHFFGKALREAREKDKVEKVQTCGNQLDWVKNDFTAEDMVKARKDHQAKNADVQKVRDALRAWKKRKYIKKNEDGTYTKLKFRSQE